MKKLLFVLALLCGSAFAQGSFYQLSPAYPNATLRVCPIGTANPCPSPSSIFSDAALSQPITQPVQLGSTGNFGFYVAAGQYLIQIGQPYNAGFVISLGGSGGGSTCGTPTCTVSAAGSGNGVLALSGNTSGTSTFTAPAVAGTSTNPVVVSNVLNLPSGTAAVPAVASTSFPTSGVYVVAAGVGIGFTAAATEIGEIDSTNFFSKVPYCTFAGNTCLTEAAGLVTITGSDHANFGFAVTKGQHFVTQAATNDMAGVCSGTTTTCSITFTTNYTSTPACVITPTTAGVTSAIITTQANSGFTVTYAPSGTTNFNYVCIGNPN